MAGILGKRDKEGKETTGQKENKRNGEKEYGGECQQNEDIILQKD